MLLDFVYQHQSASEVSRIAHVVAGKRCAKNKSTQDSGWKNNSLPIYQLFVVSLGRLPFFFQVNNIESTVHPWIWSWILGKTVVFEEATPSDFRLFLHLSIFFTIFWIYIQSPSKQKKVSKDLQTIFSGSGGPGVAWRKTTGSDNAPKAEISWRFGAPPRPPAQVGWLMLVGFCIRIFCFPKMLSWWIFLVKMSFLG